MFSLHSSNPSWPARRRGSRGPATLQRRTRRRLALERLESRNLMAYMVVDLGTLGGASSEARSLNEAGQVVGQAATPSGENHAFLWENGGMTDLGALGENTSSANDINNSGQVVGTVGFVSSNPQSPPSHRAFLWADGAMTDIGGNGSQAFAINDAGQIVGCASGGAVVWEGGVMYDLNGLLPAGSGMQMFYAYDINDNGQILGAGRVDGPWGAEWHPLLLTDDDGIFANGGAVLTDLPVWMGYGEALDLNNSGRSVGSTNDAEGWRCAMLWSNGEMIDLSEYGSASFANAINDAGQVVGTLYHSSNSFVPHAVLWQSGRIDLNSLVDASTGWVLNSAYDINDQGEIIGSGTIGGQSHAFLLRESSMPALTIGDVTVTEGNVGATSANFTVTLSEASDQPVTVIYGTANDTASAGSDYQTASGTLTFSPGETSRTIALLVNGDTRDESNETFFVNLSSPINATLGDGQGLGTILDDDPPPALAINDVVRAEGQSGITYFAFTVSLSAASDKTVSVAFATANGTANTSTSDYVAASGLLTFAPGETAKAVAVQVNGDTRDEFDETFVVKLSSQINATLGDGQGLGTILDDDPPPALAINDVARAEGRSGMTYFVFTVSLSAASDKSVRVNFATANGAAKVSDNDFVATSGLLTFAPGETVKTILVQVKGDKKKEANENFFLNLSAAVDAVLADSQGLGTILNDD